LREVLLYLKRPQSRLGDPLRTVLVSGHMTLGCREEIVDIGVVIHCRAGVEDDPTPAIVNEPLALHVYLLTVSETEPST
jgi:hypothetical protein